MSQLYVPDGTWTLCSEGKKPAKIEVQSQSTVRICGQKLAAVETDRFDGNFICQQMVMAGALIGTLVGAAVALTGGAALGGIIAGAAASSTAGAAMGKLSSLIPSICSILSSGSQWTMLHDQVYYEKRKALLKDATLNCFLGGIISIEMVDTKELEMAMLASNIYDGDDSSELPVGYTVCPPEELPLGMRDMNKEPWIYDSGFKARMYKGPEGEHILVFQGTNEEKDWIDNAQQGVGLESEQYEQAKKLTEQLEDGKCKVETVAGHSLGGGLATTAGARLGAETYTYNAAGVHPNTIEITSEQEKQIHAYSGDHDILTTLSDNRESILGITPLTFLLELTGALPRNNGQRIELETDVSWFPNPAEGHSMKYLINALEKEIALQETPVNVEALNK